ncbi:hypothetical protein HYH03_016774 [Edaphochlamys debaryana]|uniref:Uncharacterized protein n=1 Tax=Edaphochlamys debaryana TaxID=47281 RepID=A0A835XNV9_9CHLO|nr:hypothetical protein HYH03_016774 [Edaphochlamys debaryana]|eukprot:KAG2484355.1 hypothetical protein HYH03_016774 [Edaphochlamys debaryana]
MAMQPQGGDRLAGVGIGAAGDTAISQTVVSSGFDATGIPVTTYQTYTAGAVPATSPDGVTAGFATFQTYTATTVNAPGDLTGAAMMSPGAAAPMATRAEVVDVTGMEGEEEEKEDEEEDFDDEILQDTGIEGEEMAMAKAPTDPAADMGTAGASGRDMGDVGGGGMGGDMGMMGAGVGMGGGMGGGMAADMGVGETKGTQGSGGRGDHAHGAGPSPDQASAAMSAAQRSGGDTAPGSEVAQQQSQAARPAQGKGI